MELAIYQNSNYNGGTRLSAILGAITIHIAGSGTPDKYIIDDPDSIAHIAGTITVGVSNIKGLRRSTGDKYKIDYRNSIANVYTAIIICITASGRAGAPAIQSRHHPPECFALPVAVETV